jgi:hypothetical protein
LSLLWVCTSIFVRFVCVNKMFDNCTGNWRKIFTLFETFFLHFASSHLYNKNSEKCLQFVYISAELLPVKCQTKFLILFDKLFATAINFFKNCLLNACTIVWKNRPFLPNICLTRIQTFHRLFEANCLYNRMEKNSCFAEQLIEKSSS